MAILCKFMMPRLFPMLALTLGLASPASVSSQPATDPCALMPMADVAGILSPALSGQKKDKQAPFFVRAPFTCAYYFPGRPMVTAKIEVTVGFASVEEARGSLRNERSMVVRGTDADLAGFGDEAFTHDSPGTSSAIVSLRLGTRRVRGIARVDEAAFPFRLALAKALTAETIKRLSATRTAPRPAPRVTPP